MNLLDPYCNMIDYALADKSFKSKFLDRNEILLLVLIKQKLNHDMALASHYDFALLSSRQKLFVLKQI